jgi:undecaprenyl-diphosphatase
LELIQLVTIAIVQGITEFLPISSSGHLVLVPIFAGWPDQGLLIDVAVHVGTLGAVTVYLWRDVWRLFRALFRIGRGTGDPDVRLLFHLVIATIPVVIAGLLIHKFVGNGLRTLPVIGWTTLIFGLALYAADRFGAQFRRMDGMGAGAALWIGLSQILALIPGTSRSGITITAARLLGYDRREAARFSMLLSIPTIIAAGGLAGKDLLESGDSMLQADAMIALGLSFVMALIAIIAMMGWLRRSTFTPFVIYRVVLGVGLLAVAYL